MKRFLLVIMSALLVFFTATVLTAENVKLTFAYWGSPNEDTAMKDAFKAFEAAIPVLQSNQCTSRVIFPGQIRSKAQGYGTGRDSARSRLFQT